MTSVSRRALTCRTLRRAVAAPNARTTEIAKWKRVVAQARIEVA